MISMCVVCGSGSRFGWFFSRISDLCIVWCVSLGVCIVLMVVGIGVGMVKLNLMCRMWCIVLLMCVIGMWFCLMVCNVLLMKGFYLSGIMMMLMLVLMVVG